jgi:hypothetical protein
METLANTEVTEYVLDVVDGEASVVLEGSFCERANCYSQVCVWQAVARFYPPHVVFHSVSNALLPKSLQNVQPVYRNVTAGSTAGPMSSNDAFLLLMPLSDQEGLHLLVRLCLAECTSRIR